MAPHSLANDDILCFRNFCLERADIRPQALVLLPHGHAEGPDQSEDVRRRETDGRGHHLVQNHLPEDAKARLAAKVEAGKILTFLKVIHS